MDDYEDGQDAFDRHIAASRLGAGTLCLDDTPTEARVLRPSSSRLAPTLSRRGTQAVPDLREDPPRRPERIRDRDVVRVYFLDPLLREVEAEKELGYEVYIPVGAWDIVAEPLQWDEDGP